MTAGSQCSLQLGPPAGKPRLRGCAKGRYEVITRVNTHVHYEVITSGHADGPSHYEVITRSLQAHFAGLSLRGHYEPLRNGLVMITRSLRAVTQWHCALRDHYEQNFSGYEVITSKPITSRHYEYFSRNEPRYVARIPVVHAFLLMGWA